MMAVVAAGVLSIAARACAQTYVLDDGTAENSFGLLGGGTFIALNSFAVIPGSNIITSISIAWGDPAHPQPFLTGLPYTAVLWSDPNGDGSPTDAEVLAMTSGTIANPSTNTFNVSPITPTAVLTPNFFVGFIIFTDFGYNSPAALDQTDPTFSDRSFIKVGFDPNNLSGATPNEDSGIDGNWLIRAEAIPEPSSLGLLIVGLAGITYLAGRRRLFER
jgi:hypothetical protein